MILKCVDGPMNGAIYSLSRDSGQPSTNRKPDGLWFDGKDERGRNVMHRYIDDGLMQDGEDIAMVYRYEGPVPDGEFMEPWCNTIMEQPVHDRPTHPDEVSKPIRDEINRIMGQHPLTTTKLECANCAEVSSNPGQFIPDGRWVCTESCRKELAAKQSYDDLAESGGIVDAP